MESNENGLYFSARIDTSRLQADAEKASGILSNIDKQASQEGNKIKELFSNVPVVTIDIATNAPTTLSAVAAAFEEIDRVTDTNKAAIRELTAEYDKLFTQKNIASKTGTKDEYIAIQKEMVAIKANIKLREQVNKEAEVTADELLKVEQRLQKEAEAAQKASEKTQSLRTQIKALSMQMAEFIANGGDEKSAEYVKMTQELGRLMDIRGDIAKQGSVFANDEAQIAGVIKGVGGLTGAFTAAQGAMSLFVGENENLQKVMLKVQSLMSITMGLQQVQQALNKDSEFRLVTINGLKRWYNKVVAEGNVVQATETAETIKNTAAKEINTAAEARNATAKQASSSGSKEVIAMQNLDTASKATNAAAASAGTVANFTLAGAFRAVGAAIRAIPVWGWIAAAIAAVVAVVGTLAAKASAAKKAANDAFNAAVKKQEDFNKAIADKVSEQITLYNKLKREYTALGNNFKAQKKYIKDNQDAFHSLGVAINGVNDANKYLIQNSSSVVAALMAQAKAAAAFDMLKDKQKELIQIQLKPVKVKNIRPEYELEQDVDRFGNIFLKEGKKVKNSGYTQKVLAEQQRAAKAKKAEEDKKKKEMQDLVKVASEAATEVEKQFKKVGVKKYDKNADKKTKSGKSDAQKLADEMAERAKLSKEYLKRLAEQEKEDKLELRQKNIDLEKDGFEKEKKQIELNYDRLILSIEKKRKEMLSALEEDKLREWKNKNPKATKEQEEKYRLTLNLDTKNLSAEQQNILKEYEKVAVESKEKAEKDLQDKLLKEFETYQVQRTRINEEYDKKRKELDALPVDVATKEQAISALETKRKEALKRVNDEEVSKLKETSSLFVELFEDAGEKSTKEIERIIAKTSELLSYLKNTSSEDITPKFGFTAEQLKTLKASPEKIQEITKQFNGLKKEALKSNPFKQLASDVKELFSKDDKDKGLEEKLKKVGRSAAASAELIGGMTNKLGDLFEAAGNENLADMMRGVTDAMNSASNIAQGFAQGGIFGGVQAIASETIGWITKAFQAGKEHAEALKKIRQETIAQQRSYNLALHAQNLEFERANTIFGNLDYKKAINSVSAMKNAYSDYASAVEGTIEQQRKFSRLQVPKDPLGLMRFAQDLEVNKKLKGFGNDLKKTFAGLADISIKTGHRKGGIFRKGRDIYGSLLDAYPELIDASGKFNKTLAESIINTREFQDGGKETLQYIVDLYNKAEEASKQVKEYLTGIFGDLGNSMSDALVNAFKNGTSAAEDFNKSVQKMLESFGKQMIFSTMFSGIIEQANTRMQDVMKDLTLNEESKFKEYVNILDTMTTGILSQQGNYNNLMQRYQEMAAKKGFNLFSDDATRTGANKGIATASQDSVNELNGRMTAVQGHTYSISENTKILVGNTTALLKAVMHIESETDGMRERLVKIESNSNQIKNSLNDIAIKGVKMV
nr:MAG TPA: Tape measure domain protein [Caudoviricetes sp.]